MLPFFSPFLTLFLLQSFDQETHTLGHNDTLSHDHRL
jgi:hypothetical protein